MSRTRCCWFDFLAGPAARAAGLLVLCLFAMTVSGCATTDDDSDMPWNTQQSWEGGVTLPGFSGSDGF